MGKEVGMVIRVGARQIKTKTTSNYLRCAGRIRGSQEKITNAVNGVKTRSE